MRVGRTRDLSGDRRGNTVAEYALIAAMVAIVAMGGLQILAGGTRGLYDTLRTIAAALAG